jgi:hypothetical protein
MGKGALMNLVGIAFVALSFFVPDKETMNVALIIANIWIAASWTVD